MNKPLLSIIIPTYNRPQLLPRAVHSALSQTLAEVEVVVVDDGSEDPVALPEHPRLKVVRLPNNKGTAAARNVGLRTAEGHWITYLDDDDQLFPHMAEVSLRAIAQSTLPPPVAALSGLEVVNAAGQVTQTRLPPTLPRGSHFFLEEIEPGKSFLSKQTLVVERELMLELGGYDESFRSRVHTEIFLRLNPVCSIQGIPTVTYQLCSHEGPRISRTPVLRQASFNQLVRKHQSLFAAHPKQFAEFVYNHALISYEMGQPGAALANFLWAIRIHPRHVLGSASWRFREKLRILPLPIAANPSNPH